MAVRQDDREGLLDVLEAEVDPLLTASIKADVDDVHDTIASAAHFSDKLIAFDDDDTSSVSSLQTQDDRASLPESVASTDPFKWYPHWERNLLNDKVMMQPREELSPLEKLKLVSRLSLATSASSIDTIASEEFQTAPSSASSIAARDETFSTYTSPFVHSFALPNLPLATHFPPFASHAHLLKPGPSASFPSLNRSFASVMYMPTQPSTTHIVPGIDNQIQGPFQEKHIWRPLSRPNSSDSLHFRSSFLDFAVKEDPAADDLDALHDHVHVRTRANSSSNSTTAGLEDEEIRQLILEQWPFVNAIPKNEMKDTISGSSSLIDTASACTCGHQQPILRAPPSTAVEILDNHAAISSHLTSCFRSQSSTRAIASVQDPDESDISSISDSRTSSDMYLSPNNPERESWSGKSRGYSDHDSFVTASTTSRTQTTSSSISSSVPDSTSVLSESSSAFSDGSSGDSHRVYYPRDRFAPSNTKTQSRIGGFFRRMSGLGRPSTETRSDYFERTSSGDSPIARRASSPNFFDWSPSNGRPRAPSPPSPISKRSKRGFDRRGRSYTVRPLDDTIPDTSNMLTPRPSHFQTHGYDGINSFPVPPSRQVAEGASSSAPRSKVTTVPGFVRRLSAHLRFPSLNKTAPLTAVSNASVSATPSSTLPSSSDWGTASKSGLKGKGKESNVGKDREPGDLLQNFRLGGPRSPAGFGQR